MFDGTKQSRSGAHFGIEEIINGDIAGDFLVFLMAQIAFTLAANAINIYPLPLRNYFGHETFDPYSQTGNEKSCNTR